MTRYRAKTNENQHFLTSQFWVIKCTHFSSDYKDIQRTAKINVPKGTDIGSHTSLASQRIQKCAKIRVNECEYAKKLEKRLCRCLYILFLTATSFADFCIFYVPPPSLGIVSIPLNWMYKHWLSATYICRFYILHRQVNGIKKLGCQLNVT